MTAAHLHPLLRSLGIDPDLIAARALPLCLEAQDLEVVQEDADGRRHLLTPAAARAWRALQAAAAADGIALELASAFRSVARQADIVREKLARGVPLATILASSAPPGYSEHHLGSAIDIVEAGTRELEETFETTAAFAWLRDHASRFGFTLSFPRGNSQGYVYEPWHWRFDAGAT